MTSRHLVRLDAFGGVMDIGEDQPAAGARANLGALGVGVTDVLEHVDDGAEQVGDDKLLVIAGT